MNNKQSKKANKEREGKGEDNAHHQQSKRKRKRSSVAVVDDEGDNGLANKERVDEGVKLATKLGKMAKKVAEFDFKKEYLIGVNLIPLAKELISKKILTGKDSILLCKRFYIQGMVLIDSDIPQEHKNKWIDVLHEKKRVIINSSIIIYLYIVY